MKKQTLLAVIGTVITTVVLGALRIVGASSVQQSSTGTYNLLWLCLTVVLLLALLFCGRVVRKEPHQLNPTAARAVGVGALVTATALLVSAVFSLFEWLTAHTLPYPVNDSFGLTELVLFFVLAALEVFGGVTLLVLGVRSFANCCLPNGVGLSVLLPVFWMWVRIARYELSFVSSLQSSRHWQDLLMIVAELLFLMAFARFLSRTAPQPPRLLAGLGLCAGVTATVGCLSRAYFALTDPATALSACGLIVAADLGLAVLGFAVGFGWLTAVPAPEEAVEEEEEPEETDLLLTTEQIAQVDDDEGLFDIHDAARPRLELEDVINDILKQIADGEN